MESIRTIQDYTPDDGATLLTEYTAWKYLYVGSSGDVRIIDLSGNDVTLQDLMPGKFHRVYVRKIFATGTTALNVQVAR